METTFTAAELLKLGFEIVGEGDVVYLQYIFNKKDYINSKYLATEDVNDIEFLLDMGNSIVKFEVIDPLNKGKHLTGEQIDAYIKNGGY